MKLIYLLALVVMTTVANVVSAGIPKCSIWHMMGRILDETDCTRYYQCIFAIPLLTICPKIAGKQTYFDQTLELCLWSETSPCSNPEPGTSTITTPTTSTTPSSTATTIAPGTSSTTSTSSKDECKELIVPDKPIKPAGCRESHDCNSGVKDDCASYYEWKDDAPHKKSCATGFYFNGLLRQCAKTACPPCKATSKPF